MKVIVLGDADDVHGFALLGVQGQTCQDAREAETHLTRIGAPDAAVGLVMIAPRVARLAARTVERLRQREGGPAVVVLPEISPKSKVQGPK